MNMVTPLLSRVLDNFLTCKNFYLNISQVIFHLALLFIWIIECEDMLCRPSATRGRYIYALFTFFLLKFLSFDGQVQDNVYLTLAQIFKLH